MSGDIKSLAYDVLRAKDDGQLELFGDVGHYRLGLVVVHGVEAGLVHVFALYHEELDVVVALYQAVA